VFKHRLALSLGRTVWELMNTMSAREFASWQAYWAIEPWGEHRADLRMGILASTYANCHAGRRGKAFEPADFIPRFDGKKKGQERMSDADMAAKMKAFAALHNARTKVAANG